MSDFSLEQLGHSFETLREDITVTEFAKLAEEAEFSVQQIAAVDYVFDYLRYNKEGYFNTIFTSNKNPALWKDNFQEDDSLLCALDRIFDDATVFTIRGESFRGKNLEKVMLQTSRVKGSSETPNL